MWLLLYVVTAQSYRTQELFQQTQRQPSNFNRPASPPGEVCHEDLRPQVSQDHGQAQIPQPCLPGRMFAKTSANAESRRRCQLVLNLARCSPINMSGIGSTTNSRISPYKLHLRFKACHAHLHLPTELVQSADVGRVLRDGLPGTVRRVFSGQAATISAFSLCVTLCQTFDLRTRW